MMVYVNAEGEKCASLIINNLNSYNNLYVFY
jgi:hypothetical protein